MPDPSVLSHIAAIRARARQDLRAGAVTDSYGADRETVLRLLNEALATELVCILRYKRHYYSAKGCASPSIVQEFLQHAQAEEAHADMFAERISQLGGQPDFSPHGLAERSHAEYVAGETPGEMLEEDLVAKRIAIDGYRATARYLGASDPTTRRLFEEVLAVEEEHAGRLVRLIRQLGEKRGEQPGGA